MEIIIDPLLLLYLSVLFAWPSSANIGKIWHRNFKGSFSSPFNSNFFICYSDNLFIVRCTVKGQISKFDNFGNVSERYLYWWKYNEKPYFF